MLPAQSTLDLDSEVIMFVTHVYILCRPFPGGSIYRANSYIRTGYLEDHLSEYMVNYHD